jgi:RNA recognition motif-containing protein
MIKKLQARNERRKTRGFGFVNLASEELQTKAVTEMNGKDIDGRVIAVKVAIDSPGKEDEDINAPTDEPVVAPAAQENATPAASAVTTEA